MLSLAYYCSGHDRERPTIHIISSAPMHVFADSIALGASYRNADIDPVIVQPLAYRVDRQKSIDVLKAFMDEKDRKVEQEVQWLQANRIDCVLSDAAFLGCLAANAACIPSVLITNFTFDSVYSFLSTSIRELPNTHFANAPTLHAPSTICESDQGVQDDPLPEEVLAPLVSQIREGYRCADLLFLLPGKIPIPSFFVEPSLPSTKWVDPHTRAFYPEIVQNLSSIDKSPLLPSIPFTPRNQTREDRPAASPKPLHRSIRQAPLLVRAAGRAIYNEAGRRELLTSIGIPSHLHDPEQTKIVIVSFGGQHFKKPRSRTPSQASTPAHSRRTSEFNITQLPKAHPPPVPLHAVNLQLQNLQLKEGREGAKARKRNNRKDEDTPPLATPSHIHIPGAPPVNKPLNSPPAMKSPPIFQAVTIPPTPPALSREQSKDPYMNGNGDSTGNGFHEEHLVDPDQLPKLLPDESWVAIVCGVSSQWAKEDGEELPPGFYVAPRDVYMPDLMAVADVLLGKLGYGAVSEAVESCTPFVYESGIGVELSGASYEEGDWATTLEEAWLKARVQETEWKTVTIWLGN
ncbi:hypothetical protein GLOTRDRAFT_94554 [Gloeophyllum trabeum ATCC 11539]|uniref:Uncharacterized protein n=1 Tax=Gloeophyllum trabeum (strain ATCC 11539 / FP-39264 / Madison 617) TaxID=670483 RepID=S7RIP8_GLOTA|nr:uncharacterized protein GLOTRDRAFT_94554 [Gloeophyllum trabeum ATCC 11539]EPQ54215.1 hypothetical protein GLOTRDRAFT_94554 [Gloeophyllum trabeum ATCC 11539]